MCEKVLANYRPAFFEMQVDVESTKLNLKELDKTSDHDLTIFFHEYIHFLQDISTVWGINNIYVYGEYIKGVVERILEKKERIFSIPFKIYDENENIKVNQDTVRATYGDNSSIKHFSIKEINKSFYELPVQDGIVKIPDILLIIDIDGSEEFVTFGALAIQENMAYLMERLCSPNSYEISPDFPYMSAEKVCDYIFPEISTDKLKILALCDMSLQYTNPGMCFVDTLELLKSRTITFETAEDVYEYFYSRDDSPLKAFEEVGGLKDSAIGHLMGYMSPDNPKLNDFYSWIERLFSFSQDWRVKKRALLIQLAQSGKLSDNAILKGMLNEIGSPLIKTSDSKYLKYQDSYGVEYINALSQIRGLLEDGSCECHLKNYCELKESSEQCNTEPWMEKECECPYNEIWKHFNLSDYAPKS